MADCKDIIKKNIAVSVQTTNHFNIFYGFFYINVESTAGQNIEPENWKILLLKWCFYLCWLYCYGCPPSSLMLPSVHYFPRIQV